MLHFFVFETQSVINMSLTSDDMTYGICTWMQAIVSNHLKQKRKFMLKIHTLLVYRDMDMVENVEYFSSNILLVFVQATPKICMI